MFSSRIGRLVVFLFVFTTCAGATQAQDYYPPPDSQGGWRTLQDPAQIRKLTGIDVARLDDAFQYTETTSAHGGLLVVRHGYLVYEKYFGKGSREANPDMASITKAFTSIAVGIMLKEKHDQIPDGLETKIFTEKYLPEAFPLNDPRKADIKLGNILTMTSCMQDGAAGTGIVHGEVVKPPQGPPVDRTLDQDQSALRTALWCNPGEGYMYSSQSPHVASIVLRHIVGMEMQNYIDEKLAKPMGFGRWGYAMHVEGISTYTPDKTLPHTPGGVGIAVHSTDALRFGYLLLHKGRWGKQQLVPSDYIDLASHPSPYNPHSPFSLQFEVNADGHVFGAPRDAFFKSGAGGYAIYVIPSLDMVVYKMASFGSQNDGYQPEDTGLPLTYTPDHSRDTWTFPVFDQFRDGRIDGDAGTRRTLEMVIAAVMDGDGKTN